MTGAAAALETYPIERSCRCMNGRRRPPLRVHPAGLAALERSMRSGGLPTVALEAILLDYRCPECKTLVFIRVVDLLMPCMT